MHGDNFRFDVTSIGKDHLKAILGIAFDNAKTKATHYVVRPAVIGAAPNEDKPFRLVFFRSGGGKGAIQLPFTLDVDGAVDFVIRWLAEQEYPDEEDFDGSADKGWRVYNERWTRIDNEYQAIVAITPEWALYGK